MARPVRIQEQAAPRDGNEIVLRYRLRASGVRLVTNAYFFPEGEQQRYQRARYGEMRVDDRGTGLLVRMLGEDLNPL
ncbi:membrane protein [Bordetella pertussis]|nr:membrane protein [Bordetella pertussis]CFU11063.1 membrane protein [Bordetella pertussis]